MNDQNQKPTSDGAAAGVAIKYSNL